MGVMTDDQVWSYLKGFWSGGGARGGAKKTTGPVSAAEALVLRPVLVTLAVGAGYFGYVLVRRNPLIQVPEWNAPWWMWPLVAGAAVLIGAFQVLWSRDVHDTAPAAVDSHVPPGWGAVTAPPVPVRARSDRGVQDIQDVAEGAFGIAPDTAPLRAPDPAPAADPVRVPEASTAPPDRAARDDPARIDTAPGAPDPAHDSLLAVAGSALPRMGALGCVVLDRHPNGDISRLAITYPKHKAADIPRLRERLLTTINQHIPYKHDAWFEEWKPRDFQVVFTDAKDPLNTLVTPPPVEDVPDLVKGIPIGITETGDVYRLQIAQKHILVAGASGAGKGSWLWGIIRGVVPLVKSGALRLWVADPKGGIEFLRIRHLVYKFARTPEEVNRFLLEAAAWSETRQNRLAEAGVQEIWQPTPELPADLIIIDELAQVVGQGAGPWGKKNAQPLVTLQNLGRAPGQWLVAAIQNPKMDNLEQRDGFTSSVCLRLENPIMVDKVLNDGARLAGARADLISPGLQGTGFVTSDGLSGYPRVRAGYMGDEAKRETVQALEDAVRAVAERSLRPEEDE